MCQTAFLRQVVTPGVAVFVYPPEHVSGGQIRSLKPLVEEGFYPAWHRHCPCVAGFALQVDDGPVLFPLLDVPEVEVHRFVPSKTAGEQDRAEKRVQEGGHEP
jgi:hypothetical protein